MVACLSRSKQLTYDRPVSCEADVPRYVASHPGQLSLASLCGQATSQRAVAPCGWVVKAGTCMVRVKL